MSGCPGSVERMGRLVDVDDLVDATEIARRFGVARQSVIHDWRRRHGDFPKPVYTSTRTRVWVWADVHAWGVETKRLPVVG
jgi:predicted DNA-binding transcriptional regulator AlpA